MVAGCCVCSDETGWSENPLVYCDGIGCNIGVHQACYGIVSVPSGNWYCRKCESQERSARVRCELCPSKDGALKRTDTGGWAHVVCGLYIPEVRFGSVTTMEPIVLSQIPTERYNKVCYICEQNNRGSRASVGACMQCNKAGCKQQFHVTCAQALGLLCEEAGNYVDNVKYCGYCQEHYLKLKKGTNVKTIPPYRPLVSNNSGSDESPEKKPLPNQLPDSKQATKRKSVSSRPSLNQNGPSKPSISDKKEPTNPPPPPDQLNGSSVGNPLNTSVSTPGGSGKNDNSSRFTTSNFVESVITPSESVFADMQKNNKKRKTNEQLPSPVSNTSNILESEKIFSKFGISEEENDDGSEVTLNFIEEPNLSTLKAENAVNAAKISTSFNLLTTTSVSTNVTSVISLPSISTTQTSISTNPTTTVQSTNPTNSFSNPVTSSYLSSASSSFPESKLPAAKSDSNPNEKNRSKQKKPANTNTSNKKGGKVNRESPSTNGPVPETVVSFASNANAYPERSNSVLSNVSVKSESMDSCTTSNVVPPIEPKESPPTSPENATAAKPNKSEDQPVRQFKMFQSGVSAPHMLGNQLNPASSMAQKMSDTLNDELEAHSIFTSADSNSNTNNFVGPPLYNKIISSTRAADASKRSNSPSSNGPLASLSSSAANFPQSLEELLETQWEQGGTFLMEQAQHFDIASLLTCLHKLREENLGLEEHIRKLKARRDHLLGVNARLAMPLTPLPQPVANVHTSAQSLPPHSSITQTISQAPISHHVSQQSHHPVPQASQHPSHTSHSQYHSSNAQQPQVNSVTDPASLRNIPLPPSAYSSSSGTSMRPSHGPPVYQNVHHLENGLPSGVPSHHHSRSSSSQSSSGAIRHHGSAGGSMYGASQGSNQGVVVRASNLPLQPPDRRGGSVVSSNYQQPYQMTSMAHQQQMLHREDAYHGMHSKQN
ncbi:protein AF-10 isoform X2 [Planococcus citri]